MARSAAPRLHGHAERRAELARRLSLVLEGMLAAGETFTEISVEAIVRKGGISISTYYVYFSDKADLLDALTADFEHDVSAAASAWWGAPPPADEAQLAAAVRQFLAVASPRQALMTAVSEAAAYHPAIRARFMDGVDAAVGTIERHLVAGQRAGRVRPSLDARHTATCLTWMIERGVDQLVRPATPAQTATLSDAIAGIIWRTLYQGEGAAPSTGGA
jgi:AcrR family transcriptional regulator